MKHFLSPITNIGTWITGLLLLVSFCLPLKAFEEVIGKSPSQYGSLPDLETLKKKVDSIKNGNRSVLQDSAESHGLRVIEATPTNLNGTEPKINSSTFNNPSVQRLPVPKRPPVHKSITLRLPGSS